MNNDFSDNLTPLLKAEKKRTFFKAQNRIACLMFLLLVCEILAGIALVILSAACPSLTADPRADAIANGLVYVFYMLTPALVYYALRRKDGSHKVKHEKPENPHTVALFFFSLGLIYVGQLVSFFMGTAFSEAGIDLYANSEIAASPDVVLMIIQIVTIAALPAILEELLTRHIILTELSRYGRGFAIMISALLFSLMHMNPVQIPFAFIAGLAMAYTTVATGSVMPSCLLHFVNNSISIVLTFLPSFVDERVVYITDLAVTSVILITGSAAGVYLLLIKRKKKADVTDRPEETFCGEPAVMNIEETAGGSVAEAAVKTEEGPTSEEKAEKINVIEGKIIGNLSPAMSAYIISAIVCTILTFFILWLQSGIS